MRISISKLAAVSLGLSMGLASASQASVYFQFSNSSTSPTGGNTGTASQGSSFNFSLFITSTSPVVTDSVVAVDYLLESLNSAYSPVSKYFTITARNSSTGAFNSPDATDAQVATTAYGPLLNPSNSSNLGAALTNANDPAISSASALVANYTLSVASNAPIGTYDITTTVVNAFYPVNAEYADNNNGNDPEQPVQKANGGTTDVTPYVITVSSAPMPEPGIIGLIAVVGITGLVKRRRRAT